MATVFYLRKNEYIALCDLLKWSGLAASGGQAKAVVAEGQVRRNGLVERRKTAKIRAGEMIEWNGAAIVVENGDGDSKR